MREKVSSANPLWINALPMRCLIFQEETTASKISDAGTEGHVYIYKRHEYTAISEIGGGGFVGRISNYAVSPACVYVERISVPDYI